MIRDFLWRWFFHEYVRVEYLYCDPCWDHSGELSEHHCLMPTYCNCGVKVMHV